MSYIDDIKNTLAFVGEKIPDMARIEYSEISETAERLNIIQQLPEWHAVYSIFENGKLRSIDVFKGDYPNTNYVIRWTSYAGYDLGYPNEYK